MKKKLLALGFIAILSITTYVGYKSLEGLSRLDLDDIFAVDFDDD